jgi:hypothetical protein
MRQQWLGAYANAAEGTLDAAPTNALVAVVAHERSGQERKKPGKTRLRSAGELLMVMTEKAARSARVSGTLRPDA